jgi:iron complex outermembrane receptor protein
MRGVGWNAGLEPGVGVFIDGMYQPQIGFDLAFLDLERVEVLRGPQGTLFGRNTQGGALNMVSRKPDETFRGRVRVDLAEFNSLRVTSGLSGPIADNVFAGASVEYARTDGYIHNTTLDEDQIPSERVTARGILRWLPSESLEINLIGDASIKDYNEMMRGVPLASEGFDSNGDEDRSDDADNAGVQLNVDFDFNEDVTLSSISGYRVSDTDVFGDTDSRPTSQVVTIFPPVAPQTDRPTPVQGATTPFHIKMEFLSQELRLAGTSGDLDWLGGLYWFRQDTDEDRYRHLGNGIAFPFAVYIEEHFFEIRDGWAAFGQASYRFSDRFEATFGARYSDENVETGGLRLIYLLGDPGPDAPALTDKAATTGGDNVSVMASISYDMTENSLVYLTYAEGWKAGGINRIPSNAAGVVPYDDEFSENYEVGVKTSWANGKASLNGSLYRIDITDQQVFNYIPSPTAGGVPISAVENAAKSQVSGVELEFQARPMDAFTLTGTLAYADSEYKDYTRIFNATDQTIMDGENFENVPEVTANASASYRIPLQAFGGSELELYANYRYIDEVAIQDNFIGASSGDQLVIPDYDRLDLRLSLLNDGWEYTLYVDNALDSWDYTGASSDPYMATVLPIYAQPLEPRQFGIVVSKEF